jgi:hypothetical protein
LDYSFIFDKAIKFFRILSIYLSQREISVKPSDPGYGALLTGIRQGDGKRKEERGVTEAADKISLK